MVRVKEVIVVDGSKKVDILGMKTPLPVEVLKFGHQKTKYALEKQGCKATLRMTGGTPFITDSGNYIYDCKFESISNPFFLESRIDVIPGVEITHVPPAKMDKVIADARRFGAKIVVVHGETVTEPVAKGTDMAAVRNPEVDVLGHPGFITEEEAQIAKDNGVALKVTGRAGHNITNGHVVCMARKVGAKMVIDSDTHAPENLMSEETARIVAAGAGMTPAEIEEAINRTPFDIIRRL